MTQDGGFDVEFVAEPPFETSCSICLLTLKEPVQVDSCGHRFCNGCIEELRRSIDAPIHCPNDQLIIQNHLEICDFFEISCANENCRENMERRNLIIHLKVCQYRIVDCEFCSEKYVFNDKKKHEDECIEYPLNCPNECGYMVFPPDHMESHIKFRCLNTIHTCEYNKIGCQIKGTRSELDQHLEDATNKHLSQAVERIDHLNDRISQQNDRISQQNEQIEFLFQKGKSIFNVKSLDLPLKSFTFPIKNFHQNFESSKQDNKTINSDPFYCLDGHRARLKVYLNGNGSGCDSHISLYFQIMKGPFDDMLDWPFKGKIKFSVQGKGKNKIKIQFNTTKNSQKDNDNCFQKPTSVGNSSYGFQEFIKHDVIADYKTDDTLIITCQVEPVEC